MKRLVTTAIFILMVIAAGKETKAQTRVTGHVFAEIVEASGTASQAAGFIVVGQRDNQEELSLGEITLTGGANTALAVLVSSDEMLEQNGERLPFEAGACPECVGESLNDEGKQVFRLTAASSKDLHAQSGKSFTAAYQVVFAYN